MKPEIEVRYRLEVWKDKLNDITDVYLREVVKGVISELKWVVSKHG